MTNRDSAARFRFLHAADIHLDSPLRGLEADPDAPAELIRNATRRALGNLIDLALDEDVRFVLIAGDIYDGDWPDYRTGHFFMAQAARLAPAGKDLFLIRGNHDAENRMTRALRPPAGVHVFSTRRPETIRLDSLGVAIHGQSFAAQAETENLARLYPAPVAGMLNIGMLHTSADGRPHHASYAPCTTAQLAGHGYDYWALGHIHTREVLSETPWIVFPGNLQGRHINETGPKGATLVTVEGGRIVSVEPRVLDALRWARVVVDLTGAENEEAAMVSVQHALAAAFTEARADGVNRPLATRVMLSGATRLHATLAAPEYGLREKVLNEARQVHPGELWIEDVELLTSAPRDLAMLQGRGDALGRLLREIDTIAAAPPDDLLGDWPAALLTALPQGALPEDHPLRRSDQADLLARARDLLISRLAEAG
jgi:DNA repair exonuclease SbcCD nuclease subunit